MNSKFNTLLLSKLYISDAEISYSEKGKSASIPVAQIQSFDVVEGTASKFGYLRIVENNKEHIVHFTTAHNKGIRQWQEKLGFTNRTEPVSVKDAIKRGEEQNNDYMRPLETSPVKIYISVEGIRFIILGKEGRISATEIKEVSYKKAGFMSLGLLTIDTDEGRFIIKTPGCFNNALEKWVGDIRTGDYKTGKLREAGGRKRAKSTTYNNGMSFSSNHEKNRIACSWYKVTGTNHATNRRKNVIFTWYRGADRDEVERVSGLIGPYQCEELPLDKPTEAQIAYARSLEINIPADATTDDASIFITRKENGEALHQVGVADWLLRKYIGELKVYIPVYANVEEAHGIYYHTLPVKDRITYFVMRVYNENKGTKYLFPHEATNVEQAMFSAFADKYHDDDKFMESFGRYSSKDLPIDGVIRKRLSAYDIANSYL